MYASSLNSHSAEYRTILNQIILQVDLFWLEIKNLIIENGLFIWYAYFHNKIIYIFIARLTLMHTEDCLINYMLFSSKWFSLKLLKRLTVVIIIFFFPLYNALLMLFVTLVQYTDKSCFCKLIFLSADSIWYSIWT